MPTKAHCLSPKTRSQPGGRCLILCGNINLPAPCCKIRLHDLSDRKRYCTLSVRTREAAASAPKGWGGSAPPGAATSKRRATRSEQLASSRSPLRLSVRCVVRGAPVTCSANILVPFMLCFLLPRSFPPGHPNLTPGSLTALCKVCKPGSTICVILFLQYGIKAFFKEAAVVRSRMATSSTKNALTIAWNDKACSGQSAAA